MPSRYNEMSEHTFPFYPGGTSLERWNRDLLRNAMEVEGFRVDADKWWHFSYPDCERSRILNIPIPNSLGRGRHRQQKWANLRF